jgi:hypothetical protein
VVYLLGNSVYFILLFFNNFIIIKFFRILKRMSRWGWGATFRLKVGRVKTATFLNMSTLSTIETSNFRAISLVVTSLATHKQIRWAGWVKVHPPLKVLWLVSLRSYLIVSHLNRHLFIIKSGLILSSIIFPLAILSTIYIY